MGQFYHVVIDHEGKIQHGPRVYDFKDVFATASQDINAYWRMTDRQQTDQAERLFGDGQLIWLRQVFPAPSTGHLTFSLEEEIPENHLAFLLLLSGRKLDADQMVIDALQGQIDKLAADLGFEPGQALAKLKYRPLAVTMFGLGAMLNRDAARQITYAQLPIAAGFFRMRGII